MSDNRALNYPCTTFLAKLFGTYDVNIIKHIQNFCNFKNPSEIVAMKKIKFLKGYNEIDNLLCKIVCA